MDNIIVSFNVIAPVFFLMVLGYFLVNYTSLADGKLTKQANAIVFKIFLPCMLFYNVYQSDIGSEIHSRIRLCIWAAGGLLILFVLLCLIVPRIVTQENQQGVVIQGIFRQLCDLRRCSRTEYVWTEKYDDSGNFKCHPGTDV